MHANSATVRRQSGNPVFRRLRYGGLAQALLLAGCISDGELVAENTGIARHVVHQRAVRDFACPTVRETVLQGQVTAGQPLGSLYSEYRIQAQGCGQEMVYVVLCCNQKLCSFRKP